MKAKTHPAVFAALLVTAILVSGEVAALSRHVERAGVTWLNCARSTATREFAAFVVQSITSAVVRGAKS